MVANDISAFRKTPSTLNWNKKVAALRGFQESERLYLLWSQIYKSIKPLLENRLPRLPAGEGPARELVQQDSFHYSQPSSQSESTEAIVQIDLASTCVVEIAWQCPNDTGFSGMQNKELWGHAGF